MELSPQGPRKPHENKCKPVKCCGCCTSMWRLEGSHVHTLKVCGSCHSRDRYCDKICFRVHWKEHRVKCKQTCSWVGCTTEVGNRTTKYKCPCLNKRYCGPVCQKRDWKAGHKQDCKMVLIGSQEGLLMMLDALETIEEALTE
jgi:hypothetical protein